jgi:hypothetical protein
MVHVPRNRLEGTVLQLVFAALGLTIVAAVPTYPHLLAALQADAQLSTFSNLVVQSGLEDLLRNVSFEVPYASCTFGPGASAPRQSCHRAKQLYQQFALAAFALAAGERICA